MRGEEVMNPIMGDECIVRMASVMEREREREST